MDALLPTILDGSPSLRAARLRTVAAIVQSAPSLLCEGLQQLVLLLKHLSNDIRQCIVNGEDLADNRYVVICHYLEGMLIAGSSSRRVFR